MSLSGLISTQALNSQFYHDRQGHLSIFHDKVGLIITGANSKRQPELATLTEQLPGQLIYMPLSSRLQMSETQDRLSLAFNTFFSRSLGPDTFRKTIVLPLPDYGTRRSGSRAASEPATVLEGRRHLGNGNGEEVRTGRTAR